jgi:hypothetical protein
MASRSPGEHRAILPPFEFEIPLLGIASAAGFVQSRSPSAILAPYFKPFEADGNTGFSHDVPTSQELTTPKRPIPHAAR